MVADFSHNAIKGRSLGPAIPAHKVRSGSTNEARPNSGVTHHAEDCKASNPPGYGGVHTHLSVFHSLDLLFPSHLQYPTSFVVILF